MYHQAIIITTTHTASQLAELSPALSKILPADFDLAPSNPDIREIRRIKSSIGIAEIQPLVAWNAQKPFQGETKLAVIYEADRLTPEAQNSLLKTLEEPAPGTLVCLVTSNRSALLPTIRSRSQQITLASTAGFISDTPSLAKAFVAADMLEKSQMIAKIADSEERREAAITFVGELMRELVTERGKRPQAATNKYLEICKLGYIGLKSGANIKLTLETIVISMS